MQPGGSHPRANATAYGRQGNGGGSRDGRGQRRGPPAQEMTPQQKDSVLMAAGRLAAEYLVSRGDLPPDVLENRPPAPLPSSHLPAPRAFNFQARPPAPPQHSHQWELRPYVPPRRQPWHRQFRGGGPGPFPRQPRHAAPRPYPYGGPRGPAPPKTDYNDSGQGTAASASASKVEEDNEHRAPAGGGDTRESLPTAMPASGVTPSAQQTKLQLSGSSLGASDSK